MISLMKKAGEDMRLYWLHEEINQLHLNMQGHGCGSTRMVEVIQEASTRL